MTRLLERLEHLLEHTPFHRHPHPRPSRGFTDCRGTWHSWSEDEA